MDKTIRELQTTLPWTTHYHHDFRSNPQSHKDFGHALLHVLKASGKLAAIIDRAEHKGYEWEVEQNRIEVSNFLADLVICALRASNTCPDGVIDLQAAVERRLLEKNNQVTPAI